MTDPVGVSVALDDAWNVADPTWTRIDTLTGCRVKGWTIDRGRPDEFSKTDVGTATIRVVDLDGLFDPTSLGGPYSGKLHPGRQAAISLWNPVNETWHTLFRGFVESWRYVLDPTRQYMELELALVDGFAMLSRRELRVGVDGAIPPFTGYTTEQQAQLADLAAGNVLYPETTDTVGTRILAILGDADYPPELYTPWTTVVSGEIPDIFSGNVRVGPKVYPPGTSALDALWDAVDGEFPGVANLFMSRTGHVWFRGRLARFRPDVAQYGIERRTAGDDSVTAGDTSIIPLAALEWSTGQDNVFNACTATPQGVGTLDTWRPLDPSPPHNDDVAGQLYQHGASVAAYGLRSLTFDNLQTIEGVYTGNNSMEETKLFAVYYVENYRTPRTRITRMVFKARRPEAPNSGVLWEHLCNCEISDLLRLQTSHPGSGGFDEDFYVEGIHYTGTYGPPDHAVVELSLDVSPYSHYLTSPFDPDPDPA